MSDDNRPMILAIDPGTHCGYAFSRGQRIILAQSGTMNLAPRRHEGGGMRFLRFRRWLEEIAPGEVYYEEVASHKGTAAAHIYGGLVAEIQAYGEDRGVPYRGVPVGTIKKHATGKGNANKIAMLAAAHEKLGYEGQDDNTADALWILDYAIDKLGAGAAAAPRQLVLTGEDPAAAPKAPKPPSDYPKFVAMFCERWATAHGGKYPFAHGKDGRAADAIWKTLGQRLGRAVALFDVYFACQDEFFQGHELWLLASRLAKFMALMMQREKAPADGRALADRLKELRSRDTG